MHEEKLDYRQDNTQLKGHLVYDPKREGKLPAVLVAHAWRGQDQFARNKAKQLAKLGYVGFAIDVYGEGKSVESNEEAAALMLPLFKDRATLLGRLRAAYYAISMHPKVDSTRIGGIGFCFGGLCIIELFRSGIDLKGVVSFHAVLGNQIHDTKANTLPIAKEIKGSILMLHGHDDPLVSQQDLTDRETEFTQANVDWQLHIYGHTAHAFTVPKANDKSLGLMYNPKAEKRSWQAMKNYFHEVL
jgi:dienelactone hydrolase